MRTQRLTGPRDNASITTVEHGRHGDLLLRRFNSVHD
jgi:hypothetical protein